MKMLSAALAAVAALLCRSAGESSALIETEKYLGSYGRLASPTMNLGQIAKTLGQVVDSLTDEETKAAELTTKRKQDCKAKALALKKSLSKSQRGIGQAAADLKEQKAAEADIQASVKQVKLSITSTHSELDSLTEKLKKLRADFKAKKATTAKSLSQIDQVVASQHVSTDDSTSVEHKEVNGLRMLTGILEADQQSQPQSASSDAEVDAVPTAPETDDDSTPQGPVSFLQARQVPKTSLAQEVLEADRDKILQSSEGVEDQFRKEEKRLLQLMRKQEKRLAELNTNLEGLQPSLAEKTETLAETQRAEKSLKLSLKRDTKLLEGLKNKCTFYKDSAKEQKKLRDAAQTRVKMAIAMFKAAEKGAAAIQTDVHDMSDLARGALALLQVQEDDALEDDSAEGDQPAASAAPQEVSRTGSVLLSEDQTDATASGDARMVAAASSGDPFKMVKEMINGLLTKLKAEHNKDANQQEFCSKGKAEIRKQTQSKKDLVDQKSAEERLQKAAIARLADDVAWLTGEVARLKLMTEQNKKELADEKTRKQTIEKDHNLAKDIIAKVVTIATQLCGTSFVQIAQQTVESADSKNAQCSEAIGMAKESVTIIESMQTSNRALFGKFETILQKVISEGTQSSTDKTRELKQAQSNKANREELLSNAKTDLKNAKKALQASKDAMKEMKASCSPAVESYEDRAKRRQEEISALKDALQVLQGEAVPVGGAALAQVGGAVARLASVRQLFQSGPLAGLQAQMGPAGALLGL